VQSEQGTWNPPGRSLPWRIRMFVAGLLAIGVGVCVYVWPQILIWAVAGSFVVIGVGFLISGLSARSGGAGAQRPEELDLDRPA